MADPIKPWDGANALQGGPLDASWINQIVARVNKKIEIHWGGSVPKCEDSEGTLLIYLGIPQPPGGAGPFFLDAASGQLSWVESGTC